MQLKNPVMFVVEVVSVLTTGLWLQALLGARRGSGRLHPGGLPLLWVTVLFANFAESMAEGRGKAQAEALRKTRQETTAKRLTSPSRQATVEMVGSGSLRKGDVVLVEAGDLVPSDGEILEGIASVDESAVTGESAPVIREAGGDRSSVTGGTRVLSDSIVVQVSSNPGETFLDRIIGLVEGARRQKTPNEIALQILLAASDLDLPLRDGHSAAVLALQRRGRRRWRGRERHRPRGAPRLPDPDHNWWTAVGDRHRRDGPHAARERHRHVGTGGGGGGRRGRAAARQDRYDHPW